MSNILNKIITDYRSGFLSTPNIQILDKTLSDEIIKFPSKLMVDTVLAEATFKNSRLINMQFINVDLEFSYFENCIFENCIFENIIFQMAEFENCIFKNCQFSYCNFSEVEAIKITFNECKFLKCNFSSASFESCHFIQSMSENIQNNGFLATLLIDSKFSNSKKSIEFEGRVLFEDIVDQISNFYLD